MKQLIWLVLCCCLAACQSEHPVPPALQPAPTAMPQPEASVLEPVQWQAVEPTYTALRAEGSSFSPVLDLSRLAEQTEQKILDFTFAADGTLYILGAQHIFKKTPHQTQITVFARHTLQDQTTGGQIMVAPDGQIYLNDVRRILRFNHQGEADILAGSHHQPFITGPPEDLANDGQGEAAQFAQIMDMSWGADQQLYVIDHSPDGDLLRRINATGDVETFSGFGNKQYLGEISTMRYGQARSLAFGDARTLYLLQGLYLYQLNLESQQVHAAAETCQNHRQSFVCDLSTAATQATQLRIDRGQRYILEPPHRLVRLDNNGQIEILLDTSLTDSQPLFQSIQSMAIDPRSGDAWLRISAPEIEVLARPGQDQLWRFSARQLPEIQSISPLHPRPGSHLQLQVHRTAHLQRVLINELPQPFEINGDQVSVQLPQQLDAELHISLQAPDGSITLWPRPLIAMPDPAALQAEAAQHPLTLAIVHQEQTWLLGDSSPGKFAADSPRLAWEQTENWPAQLPDVPGFGASWQSSQTWLEINGQRIQLASGEIMITLQPELLPAILSEYGAQARNLGDGLYVLKARSLPPLHHLHSQIYRLNHLYLEHQRIQQVVFNDLDAVRTLALWIQLLLDERISHAELNQIFTSAHSLIPTVNTAPPILCQPRH